MGSAEALFPLGSGAANGRNIPQQKHGYSCPKTLPERNKGTSHDVPLWDPPHEEPMNKLTQLLRAVVAGSTPTTSAPPPSAPSPSEDRRQAALLATGALQNA